MTVDLRCYTTAELLRLDEITARLMALGPFPDDRARMAALTDEEVDFLAALAERVRDA